MTILRHFLLLVPGLVVLCASADAGEPSRPLIVAHRGLLRHAPENTLGNMRECLELRLGFEFDVHRTKDGHLVCMHDDTVDRTTNGKGKVADLTLAELRQLDAGSWFDPAFAGEKVPTVEQVMQLIAQYRHHDLLIAVDLKGMDVEQDVVKLALKHETLHRLLFIGRTITESKVRDAIKQVSPKAQTAAVANNPGEFADALGATNADWVYFRYLPPKEQMDTVRKAGKRSLLLGQRSVAAISPITGGMLPRWGSMAS